MNDDNGEMPSPRWTEFPFPPYSYVSGKFPHPLRDENGHRCPGPSEPKSAPTKRDWETCTAYLWGVDLYNAGFYWEAHEAWEGVWHAASRIGPVADLQKSLIKLAAAGVKAREGRTAGIIRHAKRSVELTESIQSHLADSPTPIADTNLFLGVNLQDLSQLALQVSDQADDIADAAKDVTAHVLPDLILQPPSRES